MRSAHIGLRYARSSAFFSERGLSSGSHINAPTLPHLVIPAVSITDSTTLGSQLLVTVNKEHAAKKPTYFTRRRKLAWSDDGYLPHNGLHRRGSRRVISGRGGGVLRWWWSETWDWENMLISIPLRIKGKSELSELTSSAEPPKMMLKSSNSRD